MKQMEAPSSSLRTNIATKLRRTQSMRNPLHQGEVENADMQTASSSSSSSSTFSHTSIGRQSFTEVDLRSLTEQTKRVHIAEQANLNEALESTQTGGRINPSRDGALSRLRNIGLRYGSAAAMGSAIGIGGSIIVKNLTNNNSIETTTTMIPVTKTSKKDVDDKIDNQL